MAKEMKENSAPKPEKAKKDSWFARTGKRTARWFREMRSELKKIVWPSGKEVTKNTITVLLCSLMVGICIWIFDAVAVLAVDTLIGLFA